MDAFISAFAVVVGEEGGYGADPADPGNWTGGTCGVGTLAGTKFGISAAAYPALDIPALTLAEAQAIYRDDYWKPVQGDALPPALAMLVFDAAVNNGVDRAAKWLQAAVGVTEDGDIGPDTLAAVAAQPADAIGAEYLARRVVFMAALQDWSSFGLGWARRLCALPWHAMAMRGTA